MTTELERAYYDWTHSVAYWGHNGYHLKTHGRPYAPWNKAVKAKYGDDNAAFHKDATEWASHHPTPRRRLEWDEEDRSRRSRQQDESRSNKTTVEPWDQRVEHWQRDPGSMDVEGIDTKRPRPLGLTGSKTRIPR